ncbi:MAG: carbohydrate ABC transporter permease [Butyricicoccus sp.]
MAGRCSQHLSGRVRRAERFVKKMVHTGAEAVPVCILLILEKGGEYAGKEEKYLTRDQRDNRTAWLYLLPALLFLAVMIAYPLGKVIHDAFSQVNLVKPNVSGFAGLDNFKTILNDEHFWNDAKNTVIWTVCSVAGEYIVGMLAAVLLNQKFKGRAIFRTCVFIPWLVPIIVAGMTWDWMLNTDFGIVNYLLTHLHIVQAPINFLGDARFAMATVIFVNIWRSFRTTRFLSWLRCSRFPATCRRQRRSTARACSPASSALRCRS